MAVISERSKIINEAFANRDTRATRNYPLCYAFYTFFMVKLVGHGCGAVSSYTRRVDLFKFELAFIPIHENNNHWCLLVQSFDKSRILILYTRPLVKNNSICN